jgi:hypothetical protein
MQISGANLLMASQQAAQTQSVKAQSVKAQSAQATPAGVNFMAALAKTKKNDELFAPLDFKPADAPAPAPAAAAAAPPAGYNPDQRPGSTLDIRV